MKPIPELRSHQECFPYVAKYPVIETAVVKMWVYQRLSYPWLKKPHFSTLHQDRLDHG